MNVSCFSPPSHGICLFPARRLHGSISNLYQPRRHRCAPSYRHPRDAQLCGETAPSRCTRRSSAGPLLLAPPRSLPAPSPPPPCRLPAASSRLPAASLLPPRRLPAASLLPPFCFPAARLYNNVRARAVPLSFPCVLGAALSVLFAAAVRRQPSVRRPAARPPPAPPPLPSRPAAPAIPPLLPAPSRPFSPPRLAPFPRAIPPLSPSFPPPFPPFSAPNPPFFAFFCPEGKKTCGKVWWNGKVAVPLHPQTRGGASCKEAPGS